MKLYTSYFGNIRHLPDNLTLVSIAGKTPDWFCGAKYPTHDRYSKLAPRWDWWKEWKDKFGSNPDSDESIAWYSQKYFDTVLNQLDANVVLDDLKGISWGQDVCLLCYETPDRFCHRKLVAKWFNDKGIEVREWVNE